MRRRRSAVVCASAGDEPAMAHAGTPSAISRRNSAREIEAITTHDDQRRKIAELAEIYLLCDLRVFCVECRIQIYVPTPATAAAMNPKHKLMTKITMAATTIYGMTLSPGVFITGVRLRSKT